MLVLYMEGSLKHVQYLADTALVVAKHRGCLELISQTARLLGAKHALNKREDSLRCS
jgi:hypothetical protein